MASRPGLMAAVVALGLVAGSGAGCSTPTTGDSCICTESFAFLLINVHDASGQPVTGVTLTITQVRTGQVLAVQQDFAGAYIILDDSFRTVIAPEGETLHVTGQKGSATFSADIVVKTDACHCHVSRVSGPTVVTIR